MSGPEGGWSRSYRGLRDISQGTHESDREKSGEKSERGSGDKGENHWEEDRKTEGVLLFAQPAQKSSFSPQVLTSGLLMATTFLGC